MDGVSADGMATSPKAAKLDQHALLDSGRHHEGSKPNGTANGPLGTPNHNHVSSKNGHHSSSKHRHSSSKHSSSSDRKHGDKRHSSSGSGDKKHHSSSGDKKHSSSSSKHSSSSSGDKKHSSSNDKKSISSSGEKKHSSSSSSGEKKHHTSPDKKHSSGSGEKKHHSSSKSKEHSSSSKEGSAKHSNSSDQKHKDPQKFSSPERNNAGDGIKMETSPAKVKLGSPVNHPDVKPEPMSPVKFEPIVADDSEDDMPLINRKAKISSPPLKREAPDEDDKPLKPHKAKKMKVEKKEAKKRKVKHEETDEPSNKKKKKAMPSTPKKAGKKGEEAKETWRWWEEERKDDGTKWKFLEHKGPVLAPLYEPLPASVKFYYDGKQMKLTEPTEEVMTFYGRMIDHDYTTMDTFNKNFLKDWRSVMTGEERKALTDIKKCNFNEINEHFKRKSEERKAMSKDEKAKIKQDNAEQQEHFGFCAMDDHREKIGNFKVEPPGLFRGRGTHPKMGMLKRRVQPEDIIINCSKDSVVPKAPAGHRWREVRHDNTVTWLASWTENIQGAIKYIMLNAASRLKGEKDWMKYETARRLHKCVDKIRAQYREDWKSKEMRVRQRAVALYFIDKLALRAGNEKEEDTADTVGCCSLRVEHLKLCELLDGKEWVVEFDFLGKDSIRYYNKVCVEKRVFKNLQLFMENKQAGDDLFDRLNTTIMNKHLQYLMEGLTAKVFRTFNASRTLQEQLELLTNSDDPVPAKLLSYNRANRAVAVLCNHQRAVPKNFTKQMENMQVKIDSKKDAIYQAKRDLKAAKSDFKNTHTDKARGVVERKKKAVQRLEEQLTKLEVQATDKDENKDIALGTSKLNYLDPRISVAWCKKWDVPLEKIYNKTQRDKFAWAVDMADENFVF